MRDANNKLEYIVVYVDDIIVAMKELQKFFNDLQGPNVGFTMGLISFAMMMAPFVVEQRHILRGYVQTLDLYIGSN